MSRFGSNVANDTYERAPAGETRTRRTSSGNASGAITFITAPNFEAPADNGGNNVYNLTVRATDNDGNTDDHAVAVTVTDVTESNPVNINSGSSDTVLENTAASFYQVTAIGKMYISILTSLSKLLILNSD